MLRHVFDVIIVLDKGISVDSLLVSCSEAAGEYSGVFFIKKDENTCKTNFFPGVLPKTFITISPGQVLHNSEFSPVAKTVLIFPKTLRTNAVAWGEASDCAYPGGRDSCVKLFVVISFEGKPATKHLLGISEFDSLNILDLIALTLERSSSSMLYLLKSAFSKSAGSFFKPNFRYKNE